MNKGFLLRRKHKTTFCLYEQNDSDVKNLKQTPTLPFILKTLHTIFRTILNIKIVFHIMSLHWSKQT